MNANTPIARPSIVKTIRVAYLVHEFGSGGIERCIVNLVNNLEPNEYDPLVICLTKSGSSADAVEREIPIIEIGKKPGWDTLAIRRLARQLKQQHVDVLHSHNWGTLIEGSLARRFARVPVHVHTEHGQGLHANIRGPKKWLRRSANAFAFNRLSGLATCAKCVAPLLESRSGFSADKIMYLPNGVPDPLKTTDDHNPIRQRESLGIAADAIVLGSTGRLVPVKGFDLAIQALAQLSNDARNFHLVLVGDGESRHDLARLAESLDVSDNVHFVGYQKQVGPWLTTFDLFLNTSRSEAMSLSLLEAMAAGLPVVAGDVGDNRDMVLGHKKCGEIFEPRSAQQLANTIRTAVDDPVLAATWRKNARSVYEETYCMRSMVDRHSKTYRNLLAGQSTL